MKRTVIWCGLDVAKEKIDYIFLLDGTNIDNPKFSPHGIMSNGSYNAMRKFEEFLEKTYPKDKYEVKFCLEVTGVYSWYFISYFTQSNDSKKDNAESFYYVAEKNAQTIKKYKEAELIRAKTDKCDSKAQALYGYLLNPEKVVRKSMQIYQAQRIAAIYDAFRDMETRMTGISEAINYVDISQVGIASEIHSTLSSEIFVHVKQLIKSLLGMIKGTEYEEKYKLISTIPYVGPACAMRVIINTDGLKKIHNLKAFIKYCGVCPNPYESGTSVRGKTRIERYWCDRALRSALYNCAVSFWKQFANKGEKEARQSNYEVWQLAKRLKAKGLKGKQMYIAMARKMAVQIYTVVNKKEPYRVQI